MAAQVVCRCACLDLPDKGMQALDELGRHDVLPGDEDVVQPTPGQQGDVVSRVAQLDLRDELVQGGDVGDVTEKLQLFFRQLGYPFGFLRADGGEGADLIAVDVLVYVGCSGGEKNAATVYVESIDNLAVFTLGPEGFYSIHGFVAFSIVIPSLFNRFSMLVRMLGWKYILL